uniref:Uncharacterized protein n=1 Tax=Lotus japonicus TaxID=34305 RepID=I3SE72_LOTJA|nr:unknown [Lotus japonicus]
MISLPLARITKSHTFPASRLLALCALAMPVTFATPTFSSTASSTSPKISCGKP